MEAWVDRLNVREKPTTDAKTVARVDSGGKLTPTGEKAGEETILLRGVAYREAWLEVKTEAGVTGWVFGGAIRKIGSEKGTYGVTKDRINFEYFGDFPLTQFVKEVPEETTEGDATNSTTEYFRKADGLRMKVRSSDVGEYGYTRVYELFDFDGKPLRTRTFEFTTNLDDGPNLMQERVEDFTSEPAMIRSREQQISAHYIGLGGKPVTLTGEWKVE